MPNTTAIKTATIIVTFKTNAIIPIGNGKQHINVMIVAAIDNPR